MAFVKTPNIPYSEVSLAIIDGRTDKTVIQKLESFGMKLIKTCRLKGVYEAICFHPDIMLHHVQERVVVYAPGIHKSILEQLEKSGFTLIKGESVLSSKYPGNIAYNAARVGNLAFHNLKYMDAVLKKQLEKSGAELVHVNQGYSKCSISVVNDHAIITSDSGIAKIAEKKDVEVLLIAPETDIVLNGVTYGFIGGSSVLLSPDKWAVTGKLSNLGCARKIWDFLNKRGITISELSQGPVTDIGSIIPLLTV